MDKSNSNTVQQLIFDSKCEALVNPVNCMGIMGAGLALEFKKRFPYNFEVYRKYCNKEWLQLGKCFAVLERGYWIINFPTKYHWRDKSNLSDIESGLSYLSNNFKSIKSIAVPALGCGLGGLNWTDVKPLIEKHLSDFEVELYPPMEVK